MTVHRARIISLAAVLIGISALVPSTRLHAQQAQQRLDSLRALAELGDTEAQHVLGVRVEDKAEVLRWFRLSEQGDAAAQRNFGDSHWLGWGVPKDDAEAVRWYRLAVDQGGVTAQYNLGVMYASGWGVPQDDAEAVRWYRRAADQGYAGGQYNLGVMYD